MLLDVKLVLWLVAAVTLADSSSSEDVWVMGSLGGPVVLPCQVPILPPRDGSSSSEQQDLRITWTKLGDKEVRVLQVQGGVIDVEPAFKGRVSVPNQPEETGDVSLTVLRLRLKDAGTYRCEVSHGAQATEETLSLDVSGVCFHYRGNRDRYSLNFHQAKKACKDMDASIATPEQLLSAYEDGYDQCDAGWLSDQTVRYPNVIVRKNCDSNQQEPGVRTYGKKSVNDTYDVYCYAAKLRGEVFYAGVKLTLSEASEECVRRTASLASTGQLYAAWRRGMHRCDYGWLSDGSVRSPFSDSKAPCDRNAPGVRTFYRNKTLMTFPLPDEKFGAYCFKEHCEDLKKPEEQNKAEGDAVFLSFPCSSSKPRLFVEWQFEETPMMQWNLKENRINPAYQQRASYDHSDSTLGIMNLTTRDSGTYKIRVHFADKSLFVGETSLRVFKNIEDVRLTRSEEVLVEGQSSALFTCDAAGDITFVKWMKDGEDLSPDDRISFSDGRSVSVSPVMRSDTGAYQCSAGNPVTSQTTDPTIITVHYGPEDVQISGPDEAFVSSRVTLSCSAASEPSASLIWRYNGEEVTGVTGDTFLIPQSDVTHSGEYSCTATNHITERSVITSHALLVKGCEEMQMPEEEQGSEGDSVVLGPSCLSFSPSEKLFALWRFEPEGKRGESLVLTYFPLSQEYLFHSKQRSRSCFTSHNFNLEVRNLKVSDAGKYKLYLYYLERIVSVGETTLRVHDQIKPEDKP